ncbi:GntR family transcriptional regulator [Clostridium sp. 19966]|uniref:GntR family transcriptional regulator n=1 Tax=Clostridium sp. 19966 TaxID=2768166 RepID=UPI0028DEA2E7|nr:GntR family transcriptional regulator [Clostridium sp. 19966]MDT8719492.1 GntR family transcriptional regulator [Clostridium sp. 19966]
MRILISNSSGEPIYEQITNQLKNLIFSGDIMEGELLPSIRSLAQELKISVITTKRAYEELEREGFIYTVPGKGSYVTEQNKELLREKRMNLIEEKLMEAIEESKLLNLSLDNIKEMLEILYNNED